MKFTICTGNPVDGFGLHGVFETMEEAIETASDFDDQWSVMTIHEADDPEPEPIWEHDR